MDPSLMPPEAQIEWLLLDKYSGWSSEDLLFRTTNESVALETEERLAYYSDLLNLTDLQLHGLITERINVRILEAQQTRTAREAILFFNKPGAFVDIVHWSKRLIWTIEETVALSLRRDPDRVNVATLHHDANASSDTAFAREFVARMRIAASFVTAGELQLEGTPNEMLEWLSRADLSYPEQLIHAVERMGHRVRNWKAEFENLCSELDQKEIELLECRRVNDAWRERCVGLIRENEESVRSLSDQLALKSSEVERLQNALQEALDSQQSTKGVDVRRHNSALAALYGVVCEKYHYDTGKDLGKSAIANIHGTLARQGIELSEKTIRSLLTDSSSHTAKLRK